MNEYYTLEFYDRTFLFMLECSKWYDTQRIIRTGIRLYEILKNLTYIQWTWHSVTSCNQQSSLLCIARIFIQTYYFYIKAMLFAEAQCIAQDSENCCASHNQICRSRIKNSNYQIIIYNVTVWFFINELIISYLIFLQR